MAYARPSATCSVYVYHHMDRFIRCSCCSIGHLAPVPTETVDLATPEEMIFHLMCHLEAGDAVPDEVFDRLRNGDW